VDKDEILVADDTSANHKLLMNILESNAYKVSLCEFSVIF